MAATAFGRHLVSSIHPALITEMTHGMDTKSHEDKFSQASQRAMDHFESAMVPGAFLVDTFPIRSSPGLWVWDAQLTIEPTVKSVPNWFHGAGFKVRKGLLETLRYSC